MRYLKQILLFLALIVPAKLAENALLGWGDDQIARVLGITEPSFGKVVAITLRWGAPVLTLALLFGIYNNYFSRTQGGLPQFQTCRFGCRL